MTKMTFMRFTLAAAGLARLGENAVGTPLDSDTWLPAPAQGAIGLEYRADDTRTQKLLAAIDDHASHMQIMAERALLAALGGTCHSPIAVLSSLAGDRLTLRAALFSPDGAERIESSATFAIADIAAPAALARELLGKASPAITAHFDGPHDYRP